MNHKEFGTGGEEIARLFLIGKGYEIIAKNYKAWRKEIDIIAKKGGYIVFAEVKTRRSASFGTPSQSVGIEKQRHIITAAKKFLLENGGSYSRLQPRFDIVEIYSDKRTGKNYVRHMENAFITTHENNRG